MYSLILEILVFILFSTNLCRGWIINNTLPTFWFNDTLDCKLVEWAQDCKSERQKHQECTDRLDECVYNCSAFKLSCFNNTAEYNCTDYKRECYGNHCTERYGRCNVMVANPPMKAPAPGVPAKVYPYCIPGIGAMRDNCNDTLEGCQGNTSLDPITGRSEECSIDCEFHDTRCINYTRVCTNENMTCIDREFERMCKIEENFICDLNVTTRTEGYVEDLVGAYSIRDPMKHLKHIVKVEILNFEMIVANCTESTEVPYNLECNFMGEVAMEAFAPVVFEGRAYDPTNGVRNFLAGWDHGYRLLCEQECWYHLIKRSKSCWPKLPLQYFLPGADYRTFELFIRNATDLMCYQTPAPAIKYEGDQKFLNKGNSCIAFFDPTHNLTKTHFETIQLKCKDIAQEQDHCSDECRAAVDDMKETFGCCIGMIVRQFDYAKDWLALVNYDNNFMLMMLKRCHNETEILQLTEVEACDKLVYFSLAVEFVKYLMYVMGTIMGVGIVAMTISFYWQLEHEPLKKALYHF